MKVGNLVKVYDLSREARQWYIEHAGEKDVDKHFIGVITATDHRPNHCTVLRAGSTQQIQYNTNRIEVINESR